MNQTTVTPNAVQTLTFEQLNQHVKNALPPEEQKNYTNFFHSIYKASFRVAGIGEIHIASHPVGNDFSSHIIEVIPEANAYLELKPQNANAGFGFYLTGEAIGHLPEIEGMLHMKSNRSIVCVSNYNTSLLEVFKGTRFICMTIFSPYDLFLNFIKEFSGELPEPFMNAIQHRQEMFVVEGPCTPYIFNLVNQLYTIQHSGSQKLFFKERIALQIMEHQVENLLMKSQERYRSHVDAPIMDQAKQILEENLEAPPTIPELAKRIGINTQKLKRDFKKHFNTTIYQFIIQRRIEHAKNLLMYENYTVKEAAFAVGYKNPNAFSNMFLKQLGIRPVALLNNETPTIHQ